MSIDFIHELEIARPLAQVFAFVADFENNPRWQGGMRSCRWTSEERLTVGATYVQEARFMGRSIHTHFRVNEFQPNQRISIESIESTFPIQVTRSVEQLSPDRCLVRAHIRGQPTGVLKLFSGMVRRSVAKDYLKLKQLLEQ